MPEDDDDKTNGDGGQDVNGAPQDGDKEGDAPKTPGSLEEALKVIQGLVGDVGNLKQALRKANEESKERRLKLKQLEEDDEKRKKEQMTEAERIRSERDDAVSKLKVSETKFNELLLKSAVVSAARDLGFIKPAEAYMLVDLSGVEFNEDDGEYDKKAIAEALKKLAKESQHLLTDESELLTDGGSGGTPARKRSRAKTLQDKQEDESDVRGRQSVRF